MFPGRSSSKEATSRSTNHRFALRNESDEARWLLRRSPHRRAREPRRGAGAEREGMRVAGACCAISRNGIRRPRSFVEHFSQSRVHQSIGSCRAPRCVALTRLAYDHRRAARGHGSGIFDAQGGEWDVRGPVVRTQHIADIDERHVEASKNVATYRALKPPHHNDRRIPHQNNFVAINKVLDTFRTFHDPHTRDASTNGLGNASAAPRNANVVRRSQVVSRPRLLFAVHLLHAGVAPVGARDVRSDRSGPSWSTIFP
jgi:hypothetical protein